MINKKLLGFLSSFFIVALGQPAWVGFLSPLAAILGYAVFWYTFNDHEKIQSKIKISFFWFLFVQSVQLSWMTSIKYQGPYILLVYLFVLIWLSLQFAVLTYFVYSRKITILNGIFVSSIWTILEWSRLYFISGFSWNPAAMAYATYSQSLQMASIAGVLGMSFYVIFGNYLFYRSAVYKKYWTTVLIVAIFPYLFGSLNIYFRDEGSKSLKALLVQTALPPDEKDGYLASFNSLSPEYQWQRILIFLKESNQKADLIVLPEVAVPIEANRYEYSLEKVKQIWIDEFGVSSLKNLPELTSEYAFLTFGDKWFVNNKFWAKALSNQFNANIIIGMYEMDFKRGETFNAALFFNQKNKQIKRYVKRVLVPIGEYFPFEWCRPIAEKLGIFDSFSAGNKSEVFSGVADMAVSICYEETFSNIIRECRLLPANLFINITNDVWFPNSKLPLQHFHHGKLRAVENGVPLIRACNTGITGGVDCFGRVVKTLQSETLPFEKIKGALFIEIPLLHYKTLYTLLGDGFIVGLSFLCSILIFRYFNSNRA